VSDCIFCTNIAREAQVEILYEDDDAVAFLDIAQATEGHTLVVPREHCADLFDIGAQRAAGVMRAAVTTAALLRDRLQPAGMNIFHASGAAAWQDVFHFHLHLVPRYSASELNLPWVPGNHVGWDELARVAAKIRA